MTMTTDLPLKPALLIGLTGLAGSGKDTVAELLDEHFDARDSDLVTLAFADPMRSMMVPLLNYAGIARPLDYMRDRTLKEDVIPALGVSYRHLMQTLGTEWGQQCMGRDFWVRLLAARMRFCLGLGMTRFVIPDVRFAPEADWLREQGGVIWRIERVGVAPVRAHVSETGMAHIRSDRVILNDGTLDELRQTVGLELARLNYERGLNPQGA
jgi:hypothetical protein